MNQSDTEFTENIPTVKSCFPQVEMDDGTFINEIIIDGSVSKEETKGNFILSFKEWESVTKMEGEHVKLSKEWINLFRMTMEGVIHHM